MDVFQVDSCMGLVLQKAYICCCPKAEQHILFLSYVSIVGLISVSLNMISHECKGHGPRAFVIFAMLHCVILIVNPPVPSLHTKKYEESDFLLASPARVISCRPCIGSSGRVPAEWTCQQWGRSSVTAMSFAGGNETCSPYGLSHTDVGGNLNLQWSVKTKGVWITYTIS